MGKPGQNISGTAADDTLTGTARDDRMYGYAGNDVLHGGDDNDELQGHEGSDSLFGDGGNDKLYGGPGDNLLDGGAGSDSLFTGIGNDSLTGGAGADIFAWAVQQPGSAISTVTDFATGVDKIDLSRIDADDRTAPGIITGNKTPGNEAFHIVASSDGVTPGDLVITSGVDAFGQPITIILGYTNTTAGADLEIHLAGGATVAVGDIIL